MPSMYERFLPKQFMLRTSHAFFVKWCIPGCWAPQDSKISAPCSRAEDIVMLLQPTDALQLLVDKDKENLTNAIVILSASERAA